MISASETEPSASIGEKTPGAGEELAPISMPRCIAAVLTSVSTPSEDESCAGSTPSGPLEVLSFEWIGLALFGLDSNAMQE